MHEDALVRREPGNVEAEKCLVQLLFIQPRRVGLYSVLC